MTDQTTPLRDRIAAADNPTPLRWGLDDVLHGDDDTTTVLLSGPAGEPYWLELDPERTAALRDALVGSDNEAQAVAWGVCQDCGAAAGPDCDCPPFNEAATTETGRGCPSDCPCRAVCIGTPKPAGARQDGSAS